MGGGRAVFGVLLGVAIVAALVFAGSRWLPKPEKKIEWVHSPESIIVQMKVAGGDDPMFPPLVRRDLRSPALTLYGDGTIIVTDAPSGDKCAPTSGSCETFRQARLSNREVVDLLRLVSRRGFFEFAYTQPSAVQGAPTTYIFIAAKDTQNAVAANALGSDVRLVPRANWTQFSKLNDIGKRLNALRDRIVMDGQPYSPSEGILEIQANRANDFASIASWPFQQIDIALAAAADNRTEYRLSGDELRALNLEDPSKATCWCPVQSNAQVFNVYYRPVLPYEENFPEFEPP